MIVIKGMDNFMPRHCAECWNCDRNFNNDMPKDKWVCLLLMRLADQSGEKRLEECPLELVADMRGEEEW